MCSLRFCEFVESDIVEMYNKTSATLMLQTIMVLMENRNGTDVTNFPGSFNGKFYVIN